MKYLSKRDILALHTELIAQTGGTGGLRDDGLLDSALSAPFQSFAGIDSFPSLQQKAARLALGLIKNHAFVDGNKRIGTLAMLLFLQVNQIELTYEQDDLIQVIQNVAAGKYGFDDLLRWIIDHQADETGG